MVLGMENHASVILQLAEGKMLHTLSGTTRIAEVVQLRN